MGSNSKVGAAFRAMREIGIKDDKVKPVLKKLLRLYDKNWELIEEENYRVLADAIFEEEETMVMEKKKKCKNVDEDDLEEEAQVHDEPERPLKRLRLRSQGSQVSSSPNACNQSLGGTSLKRPKVENDDPKTCFQQQPQDMMEAPQSIVGNISSEQRPIPPQHGIVNKGKQPLSPQVASLGKRSMSERASHVVCIKEPTISPGIVLLPKQKVPDTLAFVKPKDEPFTDDMYTDGVPQYEFPIAVIRPDPSSKVDSSVVNDSVEKQAGPEIPASQCLDEGNRVEGILPSSSERETNCKLATVSEESPTLEIASSPLGEEGSVDVLKKSSALDALGAGVDADSLCMPSSTLDESINIQCSSAVAVPLMRLPPSLNGFDGHLQTSKKIIANGSAESEHEKELEDPESINSHSLVVVQQCQITPTDVGSLYDVNDITKGEERVRISWVNEVSSVCLPSFKYIPQNLVFQNASVNISLFRIGDEDCCSACLGDCLSLSTPCACAHETEGEFAYTSGGFLKEEFLEECISMTRDPQRHLYCKECPLERAKNEDCLEPCKGHLRRKFIKECWSKCGCNKSCGNRVVQRGITCKLQVFFTTEGKEWGLRTLEDLPKGAFVCEYVGEIVTNTELYERNKQSTKSGKRIYPVLLDADWSSRVLKDEEALCLDASLFGNVARFINHRCLDANLVEIPVKVETPDHTYYHLAFFTTRAVAALEELTWDYGIDFDDHDQPVKAFQCRCGSKFCRNMKRSNRSRSASITR